MTWGKWYVLSFMQIPTGQTDVTKLGKLLIRATLSWHCAQEGCRELCWEPSYSAYWRHMGTELLNKVVSSMSNPNFTSVKVSDLSRKEIQYWLFLLDGGPWWQHNSLGRGGSKYSWTAWFLWPRRGKYYIQTWQSAFWDLSVAVLWSSCFRNPWGQCLTWILRGLWDMM